MKYTLPLLTLIFTLFSCVSNKDLSYLQGEQASNQEIERINDKPYKLQVDDVLNITINSVDDKLTNLFEKNTSQVSATNISAESSYFSGYSVDHHGNIRLPFIGEINVLGYTSVEVRKKLEGELKKYFKSEDDFFVSVKLAGIKYTILGEIGAPGPKIIYQNKVSILDAISNAGDITEVGNRKKVEIIRHSISGTEKFTIDLTDINAFNSDVFYIKPNDYINVLPLKQKSWGTGTTGFQTLSSTISIFSFLTSIILLARNL